MALLTTYGEHNKREEIGLSVRYSVEVTMLAWIFKYTRTATRRYSYIGMTLAAANACQAAKIAQYTRVHTPEYAGVTETRCMADIAIVKGKGSSYGVTISVNEVDVAEAVDNVPSDPATLFPRQATWSYDEPAATPVAVVSPPYRVTNPLNVTYAVEGVTVGGELNARFKYTRKAAKTYRYLCLDYDTAVAVEAKLVEKYTRNRYGADGEFDKVSPYDDVGSPALQADIHREYLDCGAWDVVVAVRENDWVYRPLGTLDPATTFPAEVQSRDYSEELS